MASISNKQMEKQLYALVECLADNYGFDVDEAYEFCSDGTDVNHIQKFLEKEKPKKAAEKPEKEEKEKPSPLETAQKNIALWTKKADALSEKISSGKTTDEEADQAALDKLNEKLEKERKKLAKLDDEKPAAKPAKKETAKKETPKKEKPAEKEKRIKRMTPLIKGQLKTALEGVKLEFSDKHQKDFVAYVEEMEDDDFRACGLADHMRNYAKSHAEEEVVVDNGAGTGLKPAAGHVTLSLKALQGIKMTASVEPPGTFWDADNGRFVKGPEAVDDEDVEEITFEGKDYGVGEKSGRVYLEVDDKDVFQGFIGVGKFKAMKRS